eukprot:2702873-Rhodomonas_salina.1
MYQYRTSPSTRIAPYTVRQHSPGTDRQPGGFRDVRCRVLAYHFAVCTYARAMQCPGLTYEQHVALAPTPKNQMR